VAFAWIVAAVADWTAARHIGLLHLGGWPAAARWATALVLLDLWAYAWHRLNHQVPILWRFHRMHHSDTAMDVTTAVRFHVGEVLLSHGARLALVPLLGLEIGHLIAYDLALAASTQFHHANVSLGRLDRPLRWVLVSPYMHKLHHSRIRAETDSNYAVVLSVWDRLAGTFRMRPDVERIRFGLDDFDDPSWQSLTGMLRTPLAPGERARGNGAGDAPGNSRVGTPPRDG
jgi:sterol desaturase/sphingolipid hydroxylase (fatty acid hydroxylase superfamily)